MSLIKEIKRKAIHLSSSWVPLAYYFLPEHVGKAGLLVAAATFLTLDVIRIHEPRMKKLFYRIFGEIVREHEKDTLTGATSMVISALLTVYCFEKNIAVASLLFLTVGDSIAAIVGKHLGRTHIFGKTLEGSLGCFFACAAIAIAVPGIPLTVSVAGALLAALVEVLPIPLDDNFRIPLSAGFLMQVLMPH
ncbi:MAG: diacylglycerol/polyprenol kinase family protein [Candidatus Eisenbacteria bacterium]